MSFSLLDEMQDEFIGKVEKAVAKKGCVNRKVAHSIFIGPSGSGKSSLMAKLLRRKRISKLFSGSTGVSDSVVVVDIKNPSSFCVAGVAGPDMWKEMDFNMSLVKEMKDISPSPEEEPPETEMPMSTEKMASQHTPSSLAESEHASAHPEKDLQSQSKVSNVRDMVAAAVKKCGGWEKFQDSFSKSFSLYLRDAGGQIVFQEMLSVLVLGPSIFIFVFRADLDLKEKFDVQYRISPKESLNCNTSSMSTEEALLQCLASVYAMDVAFSGKAVSVKTHMPLVFIVGTHKDRLGPLADKKIAELNEHLESLIDSSSCFQDLVQYADRDKGQVMFTVDNTSESDEDFTLIKSKIYSLMSKRDEFTVEYPVSYLLFALALQHDERAVLRFDECKTLAASYGIVGDKVRDVLHFLQFRVGVIQYFDDEGIVMIKPCVLFNKVTDLIKVTFSRKESLTAREVRIFEKGILTASQIKNIVKEDEIDSKTFLDLLVHLHLIIPITTSDPIATSDHEDQKYFIPSVLTHAPRSNEDLYSDIMPLSIQFRCSHCPKGLFGVLVSNLMSPGKFERDIFITLIQDKIFRDKVSFEVHSGGYQDEICLTAFPSHLELSFFPDLCEAREKSMGDLCDNIRQGIDVLIHESLQNLNYGFKKVGPVTCFKCDSCHDLHKVKKGKDNYTMYCKKFRATRRIPSSARLWFNEGQ